MRTITNGGARARVARRLARSLIPRMPRRAERKAFARISQTGFAYPGGAD